MTAEAIAQLTGFPPKVLKYSIPVLLKLSATSIVVTTAETLFKRNLHFSNDFTNTPYFIRRAKFCEKSKIFHEHRIVPTHGEDL